ncbi:MAG TPA: hypothetical protein DCQ06_03855, partial [Myxococcales bacterium]|nr:hypothetical protein [Myxococcales bacterium]
IRGKIVRSLINEEVVRQALTKEQLEVADAEVESQYRAYKKRLGRGDAARFARRLAISGKTEGGLRRELHTMIGAGKIAQNRGDGRQIRKASTPSQKTLFIARLGRITLTKLKREAQIKVLLPDAADEGPAGQVIAAPSSKRGKAAGSPCKFSFDCASKTCVNGSCSDKSARSACKYSFQCASKKCVNGSCSDGSAGAACKFSFQCTSKSCVNGVCSDGRSGSACKYGFQCKDSKRCEKGRCK